MAKLSAGLLVYRRTGDSYEVLLVHPGGPFWAKKDIWGIPKGEYEENEDPQIVSKREFEEEIGHPTPDGERNYLGEIKISSGKVIKAWAIEGDLDVSHIASNTIFIDWPPRSGQKLEIPEVDKAKWMAITKAPAKMHKGQEVFIKRLAESLGADLEVISSTQSSLFDSH